MTPFLLPAAISAMIAFVVAYYASRGAENRLKEKYERELSPQKLARQVLLAKRSKSLPFAVLQAHFGGLDDNQLRRALLAAGALRFKAEDGSEEWGLISRNKARLAKPESLIAPVAPGSNEQAAAEPGVEEGANAHDRARADAEGTKTAPDNDWFFEEAEDPAEQQDPKAPLIVTREAPKLIRKPKGLASRGRDVGVNLR
ncbi:MAG: hypothetical protein AAF141_01960, partial [Pseudomonadota bacterium]